MLTTWIVAGVVLLALELIVPGLVLVFLGAGALVIALLIWLSLIQTWIAAITAWFVVSLLFLVGLRSFFQRLLPGDTEQQSTDEDLDSFGTVVEVLEPIAPNKEGRIRHRGTTWRALCYDTDLEVGRTARIVYREEQVWIVEPVDPPVAEKLE
jgi:membrane protein implicated in regulation of membrane protease activity